MSMQRVTFIRGQHSKKYPRAQRKFDSPSDSCQIRTPSGCLGATVCADPRWPAQNEGTYETLTQEDMKKTNTSAAMRAKSHAGFLIPHPRLGYQAVRTFRRTAADPHP